MRDALCYLLIRKIEDDDTQPSKLDHFFPFCFLNNSHCIKWIEGNAFGVKKLGHLVVFTLCEAEHFIFMFFKDIGIAI